MQSPSTLDIVLSNGLHELDNLGSPSIRRELLINHAENSEHFCYHYNRTTFGISNKKRARQRPPFPFITYIRIHEHKLISPSVDQFGDGKGVLGWDFAFFKFAACIMLGT
jgi:hypothetical protein